MDNEARQLHTIPIASLDPSVHPSPSSQINAIVTLVWPYSSSTRTTALLLAELDFRLRRKKGQVRVNFAGPSARRVATSGVGIGDHVALRLEGSSWGPEVAHMSTPGRSVDGELLFHGRLGMNAQRDRKPFVDIDIDEQEPLPSQPIETSPPIVSVPQAQSINVRKIRREDNIWSSPVVIRSSASNDLSFQSPIDPFVEEDGYIPGRGRKRTLFGRRSGEWRYADEDTSNKEDHHATISSSDSASQASSSTDSVQHQDRLSPSSVIPAEDAQMTGGPIDLDTAKSPDVADMVSPSQVVNDVSEELHTLPENPESHVEVQVHSEATSSPPMSALPRTPMSPRLPPVESYGLPLVSPLQTDPIGLGSERDNVLPDDPQFDSQQQTMPADGIHAYGNQQSIDSLMQIDFPDFGNDGSAFSRAHVEPQNAAVAASADSAPFVEFDSLQQGLASTSSALSNGLGYSVEEGPVQTLEEGTIYTSNTQMLAKQHDDVDTDDQHTLTPAETGKSGTAETQKFTITGGTGQLPDFIEPTLAQSPLHTQPPASDQSILLDQPASPRASETLGPSQNNMSQAQSEIPTVAAGSQSLEPASATESDNVSDQAFEDKLISFSSIENKAGSPETVVHVSEAEESSHIATVTQTEDTPPPSQPANPIGTDRSPSQLHRIDELLDQPLPPTPARTKSNLDDMLTDLHQAPEAPSGNHEAETPVVSQIQRPPRDSEVAQIGTDEARTVNKPKSGRRKSTRVTSDEIPDVISPWFGLRRSSRRRRLSKKAAEMDSPTVVRTQPGKAIHEQASTKPPDAAPSPVPQRRRARLDEGDDLASGIKLVPRALKTNVALYHPLASLKHHLGASDSQGPTTIDIFAVVTTGTSPPTKAKSGPKDHHVDFRISDISTRPDTVQVQCFRPFAKSLPHTEVGDVVVLRNFVVKTNKHKCFLLSAGPSAWHVWRFSQLKESATHDVPQECRGPPVELSDEEQQHAVALHHWWAQIAGKQKQDAASNL